MLPRRARPCCPPEHDLTFFPSDRVELLSTVFTTEDTEYWDELWWDAIEQRSVSRRSDELKEGYRAMTAASKASTSKAQATLWVGDELEPESIYIKTLDTGRLRSMAAGASGMEIEVFYHRSQETLDWKPLLFPIVSPEARWNAPNADGVAAEP